MICLHLPKMFVNFHGKMLFYLQNLQQHKLSYLLFKNFVRIEKLIAKISFSHHAR